MKVVKKLLLRMLGGGSVPLRDYEQACVEALRRNLPPEAAEILDQQLRRFDYNQRSYHDKELKFSLLDSKERSLMPPFPNGSVELVWARIALRPASGRSIRCDILANRGYLLILEFNRPPKEALAHGFTVGELKLMADIMELHIGKDRLGGKQAVLTRVPRSGRSYCRLRCTLGYGTS
jgi:hypothetical protein